MSGPSPRPSDVARWVATLAAPMPDYMLRADYRAAREEKGRARGQLRAYGLDDGGQPLAPVAPVLVVTLAPPLTPLERRVADQAAALRGAWEWYVDL